VSGNEEMNGLLRQGFGRGPQPIGDDQGEDRGRRIHDLDEQIAQQPLHPCKESPV